MTTSCEAIKQEIEQAILAIATKHGLRPQFTEWIAPRAPKSTTSLLSPEKMVDGQRYVAIDVNIKKW